MFLPFLVATVLSAEPVSPPPTPPPLVPTEAAGPTDAPAAEQPQLVQQKPRAPRSPKRGLTIAGVAVFGGPYALSLGIAAISELAARTVPSFPPQTSPFTGLFVPVVGPIIALADPRNTNASMVGFLVLDALVQAGGLTLLIIGIAMPEAQAAKPTVWFTPTLSTNGAGAALGGTF